MTEQLIAKNLLLSYINKPCAEQGKTLVFLHGWRSSKEVWQAVVKSLKLKVESYALDLPGFGASQVPTRPMTIGDYADVVADFIKKLELKNVVLVGHSFGGRVGIKLASQHPEIISKLVLVDSAGFAISSAKKNVFGVAAKIAKPFFKPKFMQELRKKIYKHIGAEDYLATPQLQQTFINITSEDLSTDMKKITCPTLIITGENDQDTPVEFGKKMQSLISNSQFQILANAGHFSFLDKPEEFINALSSFIGL